MTRKVNDVYFIISNNGIDGDVYKALQNKKDYILQTFKQDQNI